MGTLLIQNIDKPYSPKQTCGKCHDYDLITEGYHFQQGKDEEPDSMLVKSLQWVSHPGNYGGNWCSPAPLYSYLSPKENENEKMMDLTSYTFVNKCGVCHPGGGSLEYDRNGLRYDEVMSDSTFGFTDGAKNNFDGDYYKAKWQASGVIEADCYICHLPQYDNKKRVGQIQKFNYKYAALAGSGFGEVTGSVADNQPISLTYNKEMFNPDGTVEPNIISEPQNSACLSCHAKPGYKKRGADYNAQKDVHLNAGLKCVDCHTAGSMAPDKRINKKEMHQIAKGDDPGGMVRNDLNNTMRTCADCHDNGTMGAPIAKHAWLPNLHLDRIACQTCHVPERRVKSAHYVASDVFNPGTKIPTKGKHLWTFYGPDMNYWNHYGDLEMMGYDHKPTFTFKPELADYKGMIFPVNRIHSSWVGIITEGEDGIMQPKMGDVNKMWATFHKDNSKYPALAKITDDNGDEVIEVNRPEEIDAVIASTAKMLTDINYPMEGKQVVWAMDNRIYKSANDFYELPMKEWEASPYANVHKYTHDIMPAKSAIGSISCTECHSLNSDVFYAQVLQYPVGMDGNPVYQSQYKVLGMNGAMVWLSAVREQFIKTLEYPAVLFLLLTVFISLLCYLNAKQHYFEANAHYLPLVYIAMSIGFVLIFLKPDLRSYILPDRMWFDKNHFMMTMVPLLIGIYTVFELKKNKLTKTVWYKIQIALLALIVLSGFFMMIKFDFIEPLVAISYTLFDIGIVGISLFSTVYLIRNQIIQLANNQYSNQSI
jgi:nitrate/TMAO reductase-like tetraheme cytochrome c subunit